MKKPKITIQTPHSKEIIFHVSTCISPFEPNEIHSFKISNKFLVDLIDEVNKIQ